MSRKALMGLGFASGNRLTCGILCALATSQTDTPNTANEKKNDEGACNKGRPVPPIMRRMYRLRDKQKKSSEGNPSLL